MNDEGVRGAESRKEIWLEFDWLVGKMEESGFTSDSLFAVSTLVRGKCVVGVW